MTRDEAADELTAEAQRLGMYEMTPEQRVLRAFRDWPLEIPDSDPYIRYLASEIRAAIEAEREACAQMVDNALGVVAEPLVTAIRARLPMSSQEMAGDFDAFNKACCGGNPGEQPNPEEHCVSAGTTCFWCFRGVLAAAEGAAFERGRLTALADAEEERHRVAKQAIKGWVAANKRWYALDAKQAKAKR